MLAWSALGERPKLHMSTGPALSFRKPGPSFRKHVKSSANSIIVGRRKCRGMLLHRHIGCFVRVGDRDVGGGVRRSVVGAWAAHPPALASRLSHRRPADAAEDQAGHPGSALYLARSQCIAAQQLSSQLCTYTRLRRGAKIFRACGAGMAGACFVAFRLFG